MNAEKEVLKLKRKHRLTWRDRSDWFWFFGLLEEVAELGLALAGLHKGPVDWELKQISAIAMNWLEKRNPKPGGRVFHNMEEIRREFFPNRTFDELEGRSPFNEDPLKRKGVKRK